MQPKDCLCNYAGNK